MKIIMSLSLNQKYLSTTSTTTTTTTATTTILTERENRKRSADSTSCELPRINTTTLPSRSHCAIGVIVYNLVNLLCVVKLVLFQFNSNRHAHKLFSSLLLYYYVVILLTFYLSNSGADASVTKAGGASGLNCVERRLKMRYEYDERLFDELKLSDSLLSFYRSCHKEDYLELKKELVQVKVRLDECKNETNTAANGTADAEGNPFKGANLKSTIQIILYHLFNDQKKELITDDFLDRLNVICSSRGASANEYVEYLDKLYLLTTYEHNLCGNIFRNSISLKHLTDHVLNRPPLVRKLSATSVVKLNQPYAAQQSEFTFNYRVDLKDVPKVVYTANPTRKKSKKSLDQINIVTKRVIKTMDADGEYKLVEDDYGDNNEMDDGDDDDDGDDVNKIKNSIYFNASLYDRSYNEQRLVFNRTSNYSRTYSTKIVTKMRYEYRLDEGDYADNYTAPGTEARDKNATITSAATTNTTTKQPTFVNETQDHSKLNVTRLNNCTLILLNIYLLGYKTTCDFEDFVDSLSHYDCVSNNFSVKSDCNNCIQAYKKWLCSSIIPYYDKDKQAMPCQRFCYNVQNLCPFFRPVDPYGGQPVFHCRNVVQVAEWRPDGLEDDDENYYDHDLSDDDSCYSECSPRNTNNNNNNNNYNMHSLNNHNNTKLSINVNQLFNERIPMLFKKSATPIQADQTSYIQSWSQMRTNYLASHRHIYSDQTLNTLTERLIASTERKKAFNAHGRFFNVDECFFNISLATSKSSFSSLRPTSNANYSFCLSIFVYLLFVHHFSASCPT